MIFSKKIRDIPISQKQAWVEPDILFFRCEKRRYQTSTIFAGALAAESLEYLLQTQTKNIQRRATGFIVVGR